MSDTEELETADLKELAQRGTVEVSQIPSPPQVELGPKVVVDLGPTQTPRGTARLATPGRSNGLVIVVYVLATAALAASIYLRWFA